MNQWNLKFSFDFERSYIISIMVQNKQVWNGKYWSVITWTYFSHRLPSMPGDPDTPPICPDRKCCPSSAPTSCHCLPGHCIRQVTKVDSTPGHYTRTECHRPIWESWHLLQMLCRDRYMCHVESLEIYSIRNHGTFEYFYVWVSI